MTERVLSLGHDGSVILEVMNGYVIDGPGPDFVVFENPFPIKGADGLIGGVDKAVVSVAEVDDVREYRSFLFDSTEHFS